MAVFKHSEDLIPGKFYVYRHIRKDINMPFYIGVGTKCNNKSYEKIYRRAFSYKNRTDYWYNITQKTDIEVDIIFHTDNRDELQKKEIEFISIYGRAVNKTGTLCNITEGGDYNFSHPSTTWEKRRATYIKNGTYQHMIDRMLKSCNKKGAIRPTRECYYLYNSNGVFNKKVHGFKGVEKELGIVKSTLYNYIDTNNSIRGCIIKSKDCGEKINIDNYCIDKNVLLGGENKRSMGCVAIDINSNKEYCFSSIKKMCEFVKYGNNRSLSNLLKSKQFVFYKEYRLKRNDYGNE